MVTSRARVPKKTHLASCKTIQPSWWTRIRGNWRSSAWQGIGWQQTCCIDTIWDCCRANWSSHSRMLVSILLLLQFLLLCCLLFMLLRLDSRSFCMAFSVCFLLLQLLKSLLKNSRWILRFELEVFNNFDYWFQSTGFFGCGLILQRNLMNCTPQMNY